MTGRKPFRAWLVLALATLLTATALPSVRAVPAVTNVAAIPNPANAGDLVNITATATVTSGTGYIYYAEYHVDEGSPVGGAGTYMNPQDGAYDEWQEDVYGFLDTAGMAAGNHTICVLAQQYDDVNNSTSWSACGYTTLEILGNQAPVADAGPDQVGTVGQVLTFNGSGSYDPDGNLTTFSWTFGDGDSASGEVVTHAYAASGTYTVTLTVWDDGNLSDSDTALATISGPTPPVADAGPDQAGGIGEVLTFNGNGSYDPDGTIVSYEWSFGDGNYGSGPVVTHAYGAGGVYTVMLTVTDDDNLTNTDYAIASIGTPPVADAGPDQGGTVGQVLTFNGSGSYDPDGPVLFYSWAFGDGFFASGAVVTHAYAAPGNYTAALTVWDDDNLTDTDTALVTITSGPSSPNADAGGPYTGVKNSPVAFDGTGSTDLDGTIASYAWDFGDGANGTGPTPTHAYAAAGTFTVSLTVTDDDGLTDTATATATIEDLPPSAPTMLPAVLTGSGGTDVTLTWAPSLDDGTGEDDVVAYEVWASVPGAPYDDSAATYQRLAVLPPGSTTYVDGGAGAGAAGTRFYEVRAVDDASQSAPSGDQAGKFSRFLSAGKQLISVPLEQADWSVGTVLQTLSWTKARTFANLAGHGHNWHSNENGKPWQDLQTLSRTMAIWVQVAADGYWSVAGLVPAATQITLRVGWNFLGYASFASQTVAQLLAGANWQTVEGYEDDPPFYLRKLGAADLLSAGNGYWVHLSGSDVLLTLVN